ncbi:hypothetical protein Q762_10085 [Flavobacterium cauense R2A-7]|nr:hypothetical protein Q762_10085 [Flavobacterium cauense R2A-7]
MDEENKSKFYKIQIRYVSSGFFFGAKGLGFFGVLVPAFRCNLPRFGKRGRIYTAIGARQEAIFLFAY